MLQSILTLSVWTLREHIHFLRLYEVALVFALAINSN
jgi:hypothetical protein